MLNGKSRPSCPLHSQMPAHTKTPLVFTSGVLYRPAGYAMSNCGLGPEPDEPSPLVVMLLTFLAKTLATKLSSSSKKLMRSPDCRHESALIVSGEPLM